MTEIGTSVLPVQSVAPASLGAGAFRYIDIASIDRENKTIVDPALIDNQDAPSRARQVVKTNDVLVSTVRPNLNAVAFVPSELDGAIASTGFTVLRPDSRKLDSRYLYHWVRTERFVDEMTRLATGASYPAVSDAIVKRSQIPLPPLEEQRRIAAVLERADALRQKRRLAIQKLDAILQSLFLDMFGDPGSDQWHRVELSHVCRINASLVDPTLKEFQDLLHFGSDRIEKDTGRLLPARTAAEDGVTSAKFCFDKDAILYSKIRPNLNKVALVNEKGLCSADVYPINVDDTSIRREFLWRILLSGDFLHYAAGFSNRANIPKINRDQFFGYKTILPPIELQDRYVRIQAQVEKLRAQFLDAQRKSEHNFHSLQRRAFKGELFN